MKKNIFKKLFLLCILLCSIAASVTAQTFSTVGTDFHVMFLRNDRNFALSNSLSYYPDKLQLIMTGKNACSGTVTCTNGSFAKDFTVTPGAITTVDIPKNTSYTNPVGKQAGYTMTSGFVENRGLHVTTSDSISLYAVNYCDASFDITNVLPTHALGDEYIIQNYKGINVGGKYRPAEFAIVATEDNTIVDITPTTKTGVYTPGNSSLTTTYNAGQTFSVTLNAGQTYQLLAWSVDPFDGTYIKARDCKKIAVFQGCGITPVPLSSYGYEDHLYEQGIPTQYWGKRFIVTQSLQRANDRVKVTALNDGCTVKINGTTMKTLAARETYEFEIVKDLAADTLQNIIIDKVYGAAHYIETSEPASVFLYLTSREYSSNTATEKIGDPSMVLVTPVEQQIDYVTFSTFETERVTMHHINIITETEKTGNMVLDGTNIATYFSPVPGNAEFSFARIDLEHGAHTLQCAGGGFAAHVYGFGHTTGKDESYAYTVGTGVKDLNKQLFVNDINIDDIDGFYDVCSDESINFEVTTNQPYSSIEWIFGDGSITSSNGTTAHAYANAGEIELIAVIHWQEVECDITSDTLRAFLQINDCDEPTSGSCTEITDLDADYITCTRGYFDNPFKWVGKVDKGENIAESRHTIVDSVALNATDPRTNGGLTYYPPGEAYSVRLGNWLPGRGGETMTINIDVDSVSAPIIILKYACVMQNPNHTTAEQPRFSFAVLDADNNPIDTECMSAEYVASSSLGWHTTSSTDNNGDYVQLLWKDWTTLGMDVSAYHGQTIKLQLINRDCDEGKHYGYTYFHLSCAKKNFTTSVCGLEEEYTYTAPDGFKYKWFFTDDPTNILSTSQTLTLQSTGNMTRTLCCRCTFKENNSCYFDILTVIEPLYPMANFEYATEGGCSTVVMFANTSTLSNDGVTPGTEPCDSYVWDFGDGTTSTSTNPTHSYPATGDYTVTLTASINDGECSNTTTKEIHVGEIIETHITTDTCGIIEWEGQTCDTSGVYIHTFTTYAGCDSTVIMHLTVKEPYDITVDSTICENTLPFTWGNIVFNEAGTGIDNMTAANGCDSIVTRILYTYPAYDTTVFDTVCQDALPYEWNGLSISETGISTVTLNSVNHCDSTIHLNLTVNPNYDGIQDSRTICVEELPYDWDNVTFTEEGTLTDTLHTVNGCDSIVTKKISLYPHYYITETREFCRNNVGYSNFTNTPNIVYIWDMLNPAATLMTGVMPLNDSTDFVLTQELTYEDVNGCDSIVQHNVIIHPSYNFQEVLNLCDSELPYTWNGVEITPSMAHVQINIFGHTVASGCDSTSSASVILKPTSSSEFEAEACDSYTWNDTTYTETGVYEQHFLNVENCDSTVTLYLTLLRNDIVIDSSVCESLVWNGQVYNTNGSYTQTFTNQYSCDSVVTINLTILNKTNEIFVTECEQYDWNGTIYDTSGNYVQHFTSSVGCDSAVTMHLTINPIYHEAETRETCDNMLPYTWAPGVFITEDGTSEHTFQSVDNCDSIVTMTLIVNPTYNESDEKTICSNDLPLTWNGVVFTEASDGIATLQSVNGCDSVVGMTLHVNPSYNDITETRTICDDELPYTWNASEGIIFTGAETQTHTLTSSLNCDSIVSMTLIVNPTYHVTDLDTVCDNQLPFTWNGVAFNEAGTQTTTLLTVNQCDSVVTMHLTVNPTYEVTDEKTVCASALPLTWNGVTFNEAGTLTAHLLTADNCDSTVIMTLNVNPIFNTDDTRVICDKELPYDWDGMTFTEAATQTDHMFTIDGCDSIVNKTLVVNPTYNIEETRQVCDSELPYTWNTDEGIVFNSAETQVNTLQSALGCDSTVTMTLIVNPTYHVTDIDTICDDLLPFSWNGVTFSEAGTQDAMLQTVNQCDSLVTMTLIVNPTYNESDEKTICSNDLPLTWNGVVFTEASDGIATLQSVNGCDSVVGMTLHVNPSYNDISETRTICDDELPYTWNASEGIIFTGAETQTHTLTSSLNCDSTVSMTLIVNTTYEATDSETICDSELPYTWHETLFTEAVTDEIVTFQTDNNCDSTFILTLVVNPTYSYTEDSTICASELPFTWHETVFTEAASLTASFQTADNCDSIYNLTLHVNPVFEAEDTITICYNQLPYTWDNIVFTEAGTQVDVLPTIDNCDSIVTKTLVVNATFTYTETDSICDSELPYTWHETLFTEAVTDEIVTFQTDNNCDSTFILTLVVNPTYSYTEDSTICASELPFTWHETVFTEAASLTASFQTADNCDSIYNMTLHVNPVFEVEDTITICYNQLPYTWDNIVFTEAGTQVDVLPTIDNCDSIVTKTLVVNATFTYTETDSICDSELPYTWHETLFTEAVTDEIVTFQTDNNCDSTFILTLVVNPTYDESDSRTICASELPYEWNGVVFEEAFNTMVTLQSEFGCDSTVGMTLIVNPVYNIKDTIAICDSELPYTWDEMVFTEAGTQTDTLQTIDDCDSTVIKTLIVNPTYAFNETDTICDSELPYTWHETMFTETGTQTTVFQSELGCDSTHTMNLVVMPTYHFVEDSTICASELPFTWHEYTFTEAGNADTLFHSIYTCDSSYSMTLHVNPIYDSIAETRVICDDLLPYVWDSEDIVFTEAGEQTHTLASSLNCDSTVYMTLIVNPTYAFNETDTICDSELPYTWHETLFTEASTQTTVFQSELGCDSTHTMNLVVMPTYHFVEDSTICASELPLTWHEYTFTEAGNADTLFHSIYTCDSSYSMTLHVNPIYDLEDNRTICDDLLPYTWDGVTFTEAGTLVDSTLATINGCDSIVTKHLTVNPTKTFEFDAEVCDSYTWNDQTYTTTGDYNQSFLTTLGCDSTVTLHLIVNYSTEHEFDTIACEEFVWNGTSYFESGDHTQHLQTIHSCDSVVTAHLTIGHHTPAEIFIDTCDSYTIGDVVYTESGVFNQTISTVLGCDSLITLHLNLDYTPESNIIGSHWPIGGSETHISKYHYYVTPIHDIVVIDSVEWFINCPNWYTVPIGNGEHTDLYIHTFLSNDSVELIATVYSNCGSATQSIWLHTSYYGTDENDAQHSNVDIMPNPNNGDMNIRFEGISGDAEIRVFDLLGNIIDHLKVNIHDNVMTMPYSLKTKAEATYYFLITTEQGVFSKKVIVRK